jgi:hypothetical protein
MVLAALVYVAIGALRHFPVSQKLFAIGVSGHWPGLTQDGSVANDPSATLAAVYC